MDYVVIFLALIAIVIAIRAIENSKLLSPMSNKDSQEDDDTGEDDTEDTEDDTEDNNNFWKNI